MRLQRRASTRAGLATLGIMAGIPLSFLAALILGSIFWFVSWRLVFQDFYPWSWFFWGTAAITIPLLFMTEIRTAGDYLGDVARDPGPELPISEGATGIAMVHGVLPAVALFAAVSPRTATAGFIELFLAGPRLFLNGYRHLRLARKVPKIDARKAASIIQILLGRESGFMVQELSGEFESIDSLRETLIWLAFYDWIGVSKQNDKVYIYTDARRALGMA